MPAIMLLTLGACLSPQTISLNQTLINSTGSQVDITPLINDLEDICQMMTILTTENAYQSNELLRLNSSLLNTTTNIITNQTQFNQTLSSQISLIENNLTKINSSIQYITFNMTNELQTNYTNYETNHQLLTKRVLDIESLYVTTGVLKNHNDTMNKHIEESIPNTNLTYVYIGLFLVVIIVIASTLLSSKPKRRGVRIGANNVQPMPGI